MSRIVDAVALFLIVASLLLLPVSSIASSQESTLAGIKDYKGYLDARAEDKPFDSATDVSTFTNTEFLFFLPPATMGMWDYSWDKYWTRYHLSYTYGYPDREPRINQSFLQLFSYEKDTEVKIELLNGEAMNAQFDAYNCVWTCDANMKVYRFDSQNTASADREKICDLSPYQSLRIPTISWVLNINGESCHFLGGVVRITSNYPISVMHHTLNGDCAPSYDTEACEHGVTWLGQDGVYSFYGKKLFTWIPGDVWISALEGETKVQVIDVSDHSGDATFTLGAFESWCWHRDSVYGQCGFDNSLVLITADKPVSVVAGIEDDNVCAQVFGKDQTDFLFPCFAKVMVQAPIDLHLKLEDLEGDEGSFEGDMKAGEVRTFDFKVLYTCLETPSYQWARLRSTAPIYVYTIANSNWSDTNRGEMMGSEEYIQVYNHVNVPYPSGSVPYPVSTEFDLPIMSRAYVVLLNLEQENHVRVDFSLVKDVYFEGNIEPLGTRVWEVAESNPQNVKLGLDINLDGAAEQGITLSDIRNGTVMHIKADRPVMLLLKYNRDEPYDAMAMDLIPGVAPPSPRGMLTPETGIVSVASVMMAVDCVFVIGGRKSFVDMF
jgi:hypothetical protein